MNKQEAIDTIENIDTLNINDMIAGQQVDMVIKNQVLDIVRQIHEPQKAVVPKFVAEYIERCKQSGWHLQKVLFRLDDDEEVGDWAYDENDNLISEKVDMIAQAWLDGYEVEKEQLYTVEIPDPNANWKYSFLSKSTNGVIINASDDDRWKALSKNQLTEAEIKQDFDWVWQFAKEVE
ncbi:TPA: DUF1642 domain-containing protein [Streptococcus suis]